MARLLLQEQRIGLRYWAGLLSLEDCRALVTIGESLLRPATVIDEQSGAETVHPERLSAMAWPKRESHPILQKLAQGVVQLTGVPMACQEPLQILHYRPGEEYRPHFDGFSADAPALSHGGNRQLTLILYLNAVEAGGETLFPELGLHFSPIMGGGILFRNLGEDGQRHPLSLHAGLPVQKGEKWIATQWIRQGPYV
ncbi:MAG: 2OG-Fe(II) oxygenase [Acidithiobacillus sp.]|uniref:2OG-Fe(II) oxygenase n=1 Tax=Acidithiobacillus sp. TaxID=1872118 RepID=UPI003CFC0B22